MAAPLSPGNPIAHSLACHGKRTLACHGKRTLVCHGSEPRPACRPHQPRFPANAAIRPSAASSQEFRTRKLGQNVTPTGQYADKVRW
jgi:hypothetical protein